VTSGRSTGARQSKLYNHTMSDSPGAGSWLESGRPSGSEYDAAIGERLAGRNPHGEADFVERLSRGRSRAGDGFRPEAVAVLDGGCGTGRVGIELARRGFDVTGADSDPRMLEAAKQKAPKLPWVLGDLASVQLGRTFDAIVLAGNVLIFVGRGHEAAVVRNLARLLAPGGCLVAGFQLTPGGLSLAEYDALAAASGLTLVERWATWDAEPFAPNGQYAVSVHDNQPAAYDGASMAGQDEKLRLALVEDEPLYRDLLRIALDQRPGLEVVAAYGDADSALDGIASVNPDVAMLDIDLGSGINGVQLGIKLRRHLPRLAVVLLSNHGDPEFVSSLPEEARGGWSYLLKKSVNDVDILGRTISGAAAGLTVLDPQLVAGLRGRARKPGLLARLTPRQTEILELIAQGYSNAAIAERLVLAEKSVENQINLLYQQLEIDRATSGVQPRVKAVLTYLDEMRP